MNWQPTCSSRRAPKTVVPALIVTTLTTPYLNAKGNLLLDQTRDRLAAIYSGCTEDQSNSMSQNHQHNSFGNTNTSLNWVMATAAHINTNKPTYHPGQSLQPFTEMLCTKAKDKLMLQPHTMSFKKPQSRPFMTFTANYISCLQTRSKKFLGLICPIYNNLTQCCEVGLFSKAISDRKMLKVRNTCEWV